MRHWPTFSVFALSLLLAGCAGDTGLGPSALAPFAPEVQADGKDVVVSGTGLSLQPSSLPINVAVADPRDILSASFYWSGRGPTPAGDDTIVIDGVPHTGVLLTSMDLGGTDPWLTIYRLDAMGIVAPGRQRFTLSGHDPGGIRRGGAALAVVVRNPASPWATVRVIEPNEFVHWSTPGHESGSVWSFPITPDATARVAKLAIVTVDAEQHLSDRVWWSAGAGSAPDDLVGQTPNVYSNLLRSAFGSWLDVLVRNVVLPAGAGHFAYQLESPADNQNGDALVHMFGAVCLSGEPDCEGRIGDRVWEDLDQDGIQDPGEPGLAGVTVRLLEPGDVVLDTTTTAADGGYNFAGLCAGDYLVEITAPVGYELSPCHATPDSGLDSECSPVSVTLSNGTETNAAIDFGFFVPAPPSAGGCFFGKGFWKHQIAAALGGTGRQHLSTDELTALLAAVSSATALDYGGADGQISLREAMDVLDPDGPGPICAKARTHYLATLLNYALNGLDASIPVDTDGDGLTDMGFGAAVREIESLLVFPVSENDGACESAKDMAESINETSDEECEPPWSIRRALD